MKKKKNPRNDMEKILEITALTLKSVQIDLNNLWKQSTADYLWRVASCVAKKQLRYSCQKGREIWIDYDQMCFNSQSIATSWGWGLLNTIFIIWQLLSFKDCPL